MKIIELNALPVYDDRHRNKKRTHRDKVYTNLRGWKVPKDNIECESFTVISIDFLPVYENKYYLECAY